MKYLRNYRGYRGVSVKFSNIYINNIQVQTSIIIKKKKHEIIINSVFY